MSETIAARVGRLSEATQDAVRVAAVAGREFDFDLLKEAWGKGEEATLAALDELLRQRLIAEAAPPAPTTPSPTTRSRRWCTRGCPATAGCTCTGRWGWRWSAGSAPRARAVELAFHFEQARQLDERLTDKAIAYLLQAGRQAERQSANQEALSYYQRGLDILHSLPETPAAPATGDRAADGPDRAHDGRPRLRLSRNQACV